MMRLSAFKSPCQGCSQREVGCHSNCEQYARAKFKYDLAKTRQYNHCVTESHFAKRAIIKADKRAAKRCGERIGQR